jgi:hypothetical protein
MRVSHSFPAISAVFDDPKLVSCAGLAPTMALARGRAWLTWLPTPAKSHSFSSCFFEALWLACGGLVGDGWE